MMLMSSLLSCTYLGQYLATCICPSSFRVEPGRPGKFSQSAHLDRAESTPKRHHPTRNLRNHSYHDAAFVATVPSTIRKCAETYRRRGIRMLQHDSHFAIIEDLHRFEFETHGTVEMMCAYVGVMDAMSWHIGEYASARGANMENCLHAVILIGSSRTVPATTDS